MTKPNPMKRRHPNQKWRVLWFILSAGCLGYLILLGAGYVAVRYGWSDESGRVDRDSEKFSELAMVVADARTDNQEHLPVVGERVLADSDGRILRALCRVDQVGYYAPGYAHTILEEYGRTESLALVQKMIWVAGRQLPQLVELQKCEEEANYIVTTYSSLVPKYSQPQNDGMFPWQSGEEWQTIEAAFRKDQTVITRAAQAAGLEPRLLMSVAAVEQMRLYYTQRELFEKVFKPLQILASANKMAWGVMAIKEKTAIDIEAHLTDSKSPYYLGASYESLLDFQTNPPTQERYDRLTNETDHYYSYLYGALLIKQYIAQWQGAGINIATRPEIVGTLFNIGFKNSHPNDHPEVGGSLITIGGQDYTFGSLAFEVYYSGSLGQEYPMN